MVPSQLVTGPLDRFVVDVPGRIDHMGGCHPGADRDPSVLLGHWRRILGRHVAKRGICWLPDGQGAVSAWRPSTDTGANQQGGQDNERPGIPVPLSRRSLEEDGTLTQPVQ